MSTPFYIARRYFGNYFSFKNLNAIQILTLISVIASAVIAFASILVLSVFNGLTFLLGDLNAVFYSDLVIQPKEGKVITIPEEKWNQINAVNYVEAASKVIEEVALFENDSRQIMGVVKGVDENYNKVSNIEKGLYRGTFNLRDNNQSYAVLGAGIKNELNLNTTNPFARLNIFIPQRKKRVAFGPASLFGTLSLQPVGEFSIQKEFDDKYVFIPIQNLRTLLSYPKEVSYIELKIAKESKIKEVQKKLKGILGDEIEVLTREQQNESWYKVMRFEKWMSFAILFLIMIIASFNLLSSLTMMVLDKQKDIKILSSIGMPNTEISSIFRWQGLLIGLVGALIGTILAILVIWAQHQFGIIPLNGSFVVDKYPIYLNWFDVSITVFATVLISWLASILPSLRAKKLSDLIH